MQQKQLKKEIKLLISQQSLPFKVFRTKFPQIVEITKSKDRLDLIFELFKQFAENPSAEIAGRYYWVYHDGIHTETLNTKKSFLNNTICGATRDALMSSIFGATYYAKVQQMTFEVQNEHTLKRAWSKIKKNSQLLEIQPVNFITYAFGIPGVRGYHGHTFLVIQYFNKQKKIEYRIFQSYLEKFCLKHYLKKNNNILDSHEFTIFLNGLQTCLLSDKWTPALEIFHIKYFNVKEGSCPYCKGIGKVKMDMDFIRLLPASGVRFRSVQMGWVPIKGICSMSDR